MLFTFFWPECKEHLKALVSEQALDSEHNYFSYSFIDSSTVL